ncbi:MAG: 5-carboxymethyl-2-hydroxymuconate Delta-isomerase [Gammaproteobacteria bacterium]|nr:5-carboxymethyl-2-hydroxymuconate Delta-isomerase [Gammaproteobacteria bacterium]
MPHLTLEFSSNVRSDGDLTALFAGLHDVLEHTGGVRRANCKSRARVANEFLVGSGSSRDAFVHLDIRLLDGRTLDVRQRISQQARDLLTAWFEPSMQSLDLQVTVEVREIDRRFYSKYPEGTLTPLPLESDLGG